MRKSESPKADRATLDKVGKLLPLLNSDQPGEAQAAAAALAKYDLRDVAASLHQEPARDGFHEWIAEQERERKKERQLWLERLQTQAQDLLNENSPLLTDVHRKSLNKIVQLTPHWQGSRADRDLKYWGDRLRVIRWQVTPRAMELENALKVAAHHAQRATDRVQNVFDPKYRAQIVHAIGIAQTALAEATETLRKMETTP